jgi:hypothetical protein
MQHLMQMLPSRCTGRSQAICAAKERKKHKHKTIPPELSHPGPKRTKTQSLITYLKVIRRESKNIMHQAQNTQSQTITTTNTHSRTATKQQPQGNSHTITLILGPAFSPPFIFTNHPRPTLRSHTLALSPWPPAKVSNIHAVYFTASVTFPVCHVFGPCAVAHVANTTTAVSYGRASPSQRARNV